MRKILAVAKALRNVIKYAGIILLIFDILEYAINKIENFVGEKDPNLKKEIEAQRLMNSTKANASDEIK